LPPTCELFGQENELFEKEVFTVSKIGFFYQKNTKEICKNKN
jgi:hypothetical protein